MILPDNAFVRFAASLRIFGTLVAGAILVAGMNTALTGPRYAVDNQSQADSHARGPDAAGCPPMNAHH
jgi:hypothetical protein